MNEPNGLRGRRFEVIQDTEFGIGKIKRGEYGVILGFRQQSGNPVVKLNSGRIVPISWQCIKLINNSEHEGGDRSARN